jgi:CheY-like chemotaxis protein
MKLPAPTAGAVLVIDDDPASRELIVERLTRQGYVTATAASGLEGLALGSELNKGIALGAAACLAKPVDPDRLVDTLNHLTGRGEARQDA